MPSSQPCCWPHAWPSSRRFRTRSSWSIPGHVASISAARRWALRCYPARNGRYGGRCATLRCHTSRQHPTAHRATAATSRSASCRLGSTTLPHQPHISDRPQGNSQQDGYSLAGPARYGSAAQASHPIPSSIWEGYGTELDEVYGIRDRAIRGITLHARGPQTAHQSANAHEEQLGSGEQSGRPSLREESQKRYTE